MLHDADVVIVGGGLAGCIASARLQRAGVRTHVIDRFTVPPDEFRTEQIVGPQLVELKEFGLLATLEETRPSYATGNYARGLLIDRTAVEQYGLSYQALLRAARATLPPKTLTVARVLRIATSASQQTIYLGSGQQMTARLVVLATGLSPRVAKDLGIAWEMKSEAHSLCLGFNVEFAIERRGDQLIPLNYYRESLRDRIDYFTLFKMNGGVRANLFCYNKRDDLWTRAFLDQPSKVLRASMPGLARVIGTWRVAGPVELRQNDIKVATNVYQNGVVLVGDAFQTPCPAAGHGIDRILSDVKALEKHVPGWLAGGRVDAKKIAEYYEDPAKRAFDTECLRAARYRRNVSTKANLKWAFHRFRVDYQRRIKWMMQQRRAATVVPVDFTS